MRPAKEDGASTRYAEFNPEFTYPIFGEQEVAFGYKDLAIQVCESRRPWANLSTDPFPSQLYFASGSLATYFHLEYSEKFQGVSSSSSGGDTVTADDIEGKLREFIPHGKRY